MKYKYNSSKKQFRFDKVYNYFSFRNKCIKSNITFKKINEIIKPFSITYIVTIPKEDQLVYFLLKHSDSIIYEDS